PAPPPPLPTLFPYTTLFRSGFCSRGTSPSDCTPAGLRRPDCAQRAPRFQYPRPRRAARRVFAPPSTAHHVLGRRNPAVERVVARSEEHTSELQSRGHLVCRL